jgi:hypothetical protein
VPRRQQRDRPWAYIGAAPGRALGSARSDGAAEDAAGVALAIPVLAYSTYVVANLFYLVTAHAASYAALAALGLATVNLVVPGLAVTAVLVLLNLAAIALLLPTQSNHLFMNLFLCLGFVAAYAARAVQERRLLPSAGRLFEAFAPLGRWMLILMYFYGVFHKLNTAFLDPSVSCAVVLWKAYDFPFGLGAWPLAQHAAIYGTLAIETTAMLCLLGRRTRYAGIILGVAFHWFIGFNPYQDYIGFSLLSIFLHSTFLPAGVGERLGSHRQGQAIHEWLRPPLRRAIVVSAVFVLAALAGRTVAWLAFGVAVLGLLLVFAREDSGAPDRVGLMPRQPVIALLIVLFLLNGALPYLGVKTGQTLSMFSNLTTEDGRSNHLIVRHPLALLPQAALVRIVTTDDPFLKEIAARHDEVAQWTVLDRFARHRFATVYELDGRLVPLDPADPAAGLGVAPLILRDLVTFKPVDTRSPRPCDNW